LLKKGHLRRFPHPSSLRRTAKYASFLRISGALHLTIFEQTWGKRLFQQPVSPLWKKLLRAAQHLFATILKLASLQIQDSRDLQ
jgi:hypothetical protein